MFKKFSSIENAYRVKFVEKCKSLGQPDWVALEKVHGANFGFIVSGGEVTPFKRSSTIGANPETGTYEFYGCNPVVERYRDKMKWLELSFNQPVQVYGELYGDGVQKEITYGQKDFIVFDIFLVDDEVFADWDVVVEICEDNNIPTVPEIGRGSLDEMLLLTPEFESIVAKSKGISGQQSEGIVIKQLKQEAWLPTGERAIIKNKSKTFVEKKQRTPKKPYKMPDSVKPIYEDFAKYLNKNRLMNVLSKVGEVSQKDFGKIQGLFIQDAKTEFERDEYEISKDEWKLLAKSIGKDATSVLREEWLNVLDKG